MSIDYYEFMIVKKWSWANVHAPLSANNFNIWLLNIITWWLLEMLKNDSLYYHASINYARFTRLQSVYAEWKLMPNKIILIRQIQSHYAENAYKCLHDFPVCEHARYKIILLTSITSRTARWYQAIMQWPDFLSRWH